MPEEYGHHFVGLGASGRVAPPLPVRPVFIVGLARSGSSILYRLVQSHPAFTPTGGAELSESHFLDVVASRDPVDTPATRSFARVDDEAWADFEHELRGALRRRALAPFEPRLLARSPALWAASGRAALTRAYFSLAATGRGARRLVEKTPTNLQWVPHLERAFPDAHVLAITRHPVATYASYRRRAAQDPAATWAAITPEELCARWAQDAAVLARHAADRRFHVVRYEELVADPERVQRELFALLDEAPLAELPGREAPSPHAPASEAPQLYAEIAPTATAWPDHVTADEVRLIEARLDAPMTDLGYEPTLSD